MNLSPINKAIAGGVSAALVAFLARYGFHLSVDTVNWLNVGLTLLSGYVIGHLAVYFSPSNKTV